MLCANDKVILHNLETILRIFNSTGKIRQSVTCQLHLEGIMVSEISQTEKDKYCMISPIGGN